MIQIIEEKMNDVFTKYHLMGLPFNAVIHKFSEKDKNEHIHDHPWSFTSYVLKGSYVERVYTIENGKVEFKDVLREEGCSHFVPAELIHEIIALPQGECYTLVKPNSFERETHFWKFENGDIFNKRWDENEFKKL